MKHILSVALAAGIAIATAAETVPYKSDIGDLSSYDVDAAWVNINKGNRGSNGFTFDRPDMTNFTTPGTKGGMVHNFDTDYEANCWLISPGIDLTAGTEYTVTFWTKTDGSDNEAFKLCSGNEQTVDAMTNVLIDKPSYSHADDFEQQSVSFTPETDGAYFFGINCYSDIYTYNFHVTGFAVKVAGAEDPDPEPVDPPKEALPLPFEYTFADAAAFIDDWTSRHGDDAYSNNPWSLNAYSGWAEFDKAYGEKENNWLISPELVFDEAGTYMLTTVGMVNGKLEYLLGTDVNDFGSFTAFAELEAAEFDNDIQHDFPFTVAEAGKYRVAIRACAESGSYMGYRIKRVKVKANKPVPAMITDLKAEASALDELSVTLKWTNPDTDQAGQPLDAVTKVELYRNGALVKEFTDCAVGAAMEYTDAPAEAGVYTYHVLAYNANGAHDAVPAEVSAGYVGHPVVELPFSFNATANAGIAPMFTFGDADNDGVTWYFDTSWEYSKVFRIKAELIADLDDYLVTPYMKLEPGYYSFTHDIAARFNNFEAGYVTDRHNPAATFVKLHSEENIQEYGTQDKRYLLVVDEPMEIALAIHACGSSSSAAYLDLSVSEFGLEAAPLVPAAVNGLEVAEADGAKACVISWTNPTVDNAGRTLDAAMPLILTVKRDGEAIATLQGDGYLPGRECSYTDAAIEGLSQAVYTVEIANANGPSEDVAPEAALYFGDTVDMPYACSQFADWSLVNTGVSYYEWKRDDVDGTLVWSKYYGEGEDFALSPFFTFTEGDEYTVRATLCNENTDEMTVKFVSATVAREGYDTAVETFAIPALTIDMEYTATIKAAAAETLADDAAEPQADKTVTPGKRALGFGAVTTGLLRITGFSIDKKETDGTISTVVATAGALRYAAGKVSADREMAFTVADAAGRVLLTATGTEIDLTAFRGLLLVAATDAAGHTATLKINL